MFSLTFKKLFIFKCLVIKVSPFKDTQISKLAWALSPKLLPPPPDSVATEDNADEFYKPYFYATEDNADLFYAPYIGEEGIWANMEADNNNDADSYYIPYLPYADKMSDPWLHYYKPLPTHNKDHLFEGPLPTNDHQYQGPNSDLQEVPKLSQGLHQITGPKYDISHEITQDSDNEIFDVPKILLKTIYY